MDRPTPPRSERGVKRLDAEVFPHPSDRPSARERLEAELGPELTKLLLKSLAVVRAA